jgi:hypothetical protein
MIKEIILVAGIAFYTFIITSLIGDISKNYFIQEMKISPNLS